MAEESGINTWLEAAKKAGYELLPKKDVEALQGSANTLKSLREAFPEDYRGKEADFIKKATEAFQKIKTIDDSTKTETERLQAEISALKGQHTKASKKAEELEQSLAATKKQLKESLIWGHIGKIVRNRNLRVHDRLIETASGQKINAFELDQFSTDGEDNVKKLHDAIFKEIIEPAVNLQAEIVSQVGQAPPASTTTTQAPENKEKPNDDRTRQFVMWGSKA